MKGFENFMRGRIDGAFNGFNFGAVFKLIPNNDKNDTYWMQEEHKTTSLGWKLCPSASILQKEDKFFIKIENISEVVAVKEVLVLKKNKIYGHFSGWNGNSTYTMINGEIWRQRGELNECTYEEKYANEPKIVIFDSSLGPMMYVEGTSTAVQVERVTSGSPPSRKG